MTRPPAQPARPGRRIVGGLTALGTAAGVALVGVATPAAASPVRPAGPVHVHRSTLTHAQIARLSRHATKRVIVLLRDQETSTLRGNSPSVLAARSAALSAAQAPVANELQRLHAPNLKQYHFLNAVSATVSVAERRRLSHDPAVLAVVPDSIVHLPSTSTEPSGSSTAAVEKRVNKTPGLCGTPKKPLLEPAALNQIAAASPHHGITGHGVKVAVFPDGVDPTIKDYIRPGGKRVVFDYQDFSGSGRHGVTDGGEAFGDVSSIAAQGRRTYDLSKEVNPNLPLPKKCDIKIKGVAPGAQVAVMKVFGGETAADSEILQGMDYAVSHDHVDILSQSFGGNPVPLAGHDPVSMFDAEAVRAGITVVASTGDAGITNTIGSPAADSKGVISVGATSSFRSHAQLSEHGYQLGHYKGWENNNIATLSSAGFTSFGPNSIDVVAPGDSGWANCSSRTRVYLSCANQYGAGPKAPPIEDFGGTSQACPFVAGVAALVIQAYRSTHDDATPSPKLVRQILTGTATDLTAPVEQQGAGQVNARRAVALARNYRGTTAHKSGSHLLVSKTKFSKTAAPGSKHKATVTVHNYGKKSASVRPRMKEFTKGKSLVSTVVHYRPNSGRTKTFKYWLDGLPEPYVEKDFRVPSGYDRLDTRIGFPATSQHLGQELFLVLFDPAGKLAQDSDPQGTGSGFQQGDVRNPMAGKWRAIIFSRPAADKYSGPVSFTATAQKLVKVHGSSAGKKKVPAGGKKTFTLRYRSPNRPGDSSAAIYFGKGVGAVPVLMRTTVPVSAKHAGHFSGRVYGGNGRPVSIGNDAANYEFRVPKGVKDVDVDLRVNHAALGAIATLVAPNGNPVDSQTTQFVDTTKATPTAVNKPTVHLSWQSPMKGRWEVDLITISGDTSGKTSVQFTGKIAFNTVRVSSTGLPTSKNTVVAPGSPVTARVRVKNTGNAPEIYYLDARRSGSTTYGLGFLTKPNGRVGGAAAQVLVPPETHSAVLSAHAKKPIVFDTSPSLGTPDLLSTTGKTAVVGLSGAVEASEWSCGPLRVGPFPAPVHSIKYSCLAIGTTQTINDDIAATGGNLWDTATDVDSPNTFAPGDATVVRPGKSTTLTVRIAPSSAESGDVVRGHLAVQTLNTSTFSSDDLKHLRYAYTVGQ